jgi:hypothetical protein
MNELDLSTLDRLAKRFRTAQAKAAMRGWRLLRSHPEDDACIFAFGLNGAVLAFADVDDALVRLCSEATCQPSSAV